MASDGCAFYSPDELARYLGLAPRAIEKMRFIQSGPPFYRISGGAIRGRVGYRKSDVEEWLATRRVQGQDQCPQPEPQP
jgi:hypothetical protein